MSQYSYLSKPDPDFAALLEQIQPPPPFAPSADIPAAKQKWIEYVQAPYAAYEKARLSPGQYTIPAICFIIAVLTGTSDAKYRVQDYKVPVEGGEITVRAVIPGTEYEGQKYPLLLWTHGGGQFSGMLQVGLESIELIVFSPFQYQD
jgi:hypothetical protein